MSDDTKHVYCMYESEIEDQLWSEMMLEDYNDNEPFAMQPTVYGDPSCQGGVTSSSRIGEARTKVETKGASLAQFSRQSLSPSSHIFKNTDPQLAILTEQTHAFLRQCHSKENLRGHHPVNDHDITDSRYEASLGVLALSKGRDAVKLIYSPMKVSNKSEREIVRKSRTKKRTKRRPKAAQPKRKRKAWTAEEDALVVDLHADGFGWSSIAARLNNGKTGTTVRERYINILDPTLNRGEWTMEEDAILYYHQGLLGNKWQQISFFIPGRSENSVKNRWYGLQRAKEKNRGV